MSAADLQKRIIVQHGKNESLETFSRSKESTIKQFNENNQPLNGTTAQILYDRRPTGKYFIGNTYDPYESVIQVYLFYFLINRSVLS